MKADLRISIKDYRKNKSLKILLFRAPWPGKPQFLGRMNGAVWPGRGRAVSLTRLLAAVRKALVRSTGEAQEKA
jgi:hypothetical protein